jgi:metallo-beta-lactamase class B
MMKRLSLVCALLCGMAAAADRPVLTEQEAAGGGKQNDQGTQIKPRAQPHLDAGTQAAGKDFPGIAALCNSALPEALRRKRAAQGDGHRQMPEATRVFDNFYYLGVADVSAWAVVTPDGIILLDSLNSPDDIVNTVEPGLRKFGLDPASIKYVIVTHGHGDHFGGSAYLARTYHAHVLMSGNDWKLAPTMLNQPIFEAPPPRDMVVKDGQKLTLGNETLTLYLTPGHTLGTVSVLVPVTDHGQPHVAALWGGVGFNFPHSAARFHIYADSAQRFMRLALAAGADAPLSNHPNVDNTIEKSQQLKTRGPSDPNPFVLGQSGVRRFLTGASECALGYAEQISD